MGYKSYIKKCELLGELFISQGIEFKQLAKSLKQNKPTPDIKKFIDEKIERYKL